MPAICGAAGALVATQRCDPVVVDLLQRTGGPFVGKFKREVGEMNWMNFHLQDSTSSKE